MKWEIPGNELEIEYKKVFLSYNDKNIILYGAGMMGGRTFDAIRSLTDLSVMEFWDADINKKTYRNTPIKHWDKLEKVPDYNPDKDVIIICLPDRIGRIIRTEIADTLNIDTDSIKLYGEFVMHDFPILAIYGYNKVFLDTVSMVITEKCTLKCEKCAIMLPYFKECDGFPIDKLKKEVDAVFNAADFVGGYIVTGGEPLLVEELPEILAYIGENYSRKMGSFKIITNGTILPKDNLLKVMKKYNIAADISDYTHGIPEIKDKVFAIKEAFENYGIVTYFLETDQWVDFGFGETEHGFTNENAEDFFDYCRTRCRGYIDGKLIYCINAYYAQRTLYDEKDKSNEFDIMNFSGKDCDKRKLVEFDLGYNERGYLSMCNHCNGAMEINNHYIEAGIQCKSH